MIFHPFNFHRRNQRGLTILEAMVTMAVLGAGIAAIATFTNFTRQWSGNNRSRFVASSIAETVMEEIRAFGCIPNAASNPCDRLLTWPLSANTLDASFPRLYCVPPKGEPKLMEDSATDCDGNLFQANIMVATANSATINSVAPPTASSSNYLDFNRKRLALGTVPTSNNVTLDNVANIRVTIRWNDVGPQNVILQDKTPKFFVYQTRVTQ